MIIKDEAKTILCYGDSNTWGAIPSSDDRYPRSIRWPSALQNLLGAEYEIISEGLPGRTLVAHDPNKPHRTGITHLRAFLDSSEPLSLVIIMLGTNDVKGIYNLSAADIAEHLNQTIKLIKEYQRDLPILVICSPKPICDATGSIDPRMVRGPEIFKSLPGLFKEVAEKNGTSFLNAEDHISSSKTDGYHLDAESHLKLAEILADFIKDKIV